MKSAFEEMIDQPRRAATDVDDRRGGDNADLRHQRKRRRRVFLKPADFILALGGVDVFPMRLAALTFHRIPPSVLPRTESGHSFCRWQECDVRHCAAVIYASR